MSSNEVVDVVLVVSMLSCWFMMVVNNLMAVCGFIIWVMCVQLDAYKNKIGLFRK